MLPGIYAGGIAAVVLAVALWDTISHNSLIIWLGCFLSIQAVRRLSYSSFHRASSRDWNSGLWFVVGTIATAMVWGGFLCCFFL